MRKASPLTCAIVVVLWLTPSLLVCGVGLHLALEHPPQAGHAGASEADHDQIASTLAQVAFHGHRHEQAEAPDHSHEVTISPSRAPERADSLLAQTPLGSPVAAAAPGPIPRAHGTTERAPEPPLFTSHCSLLL